MSWPGDLIQGKMASTDLQWYFGVLATCNWCLTYCLEIYLFQHYFLGYEVCFRMLFKDCCILDTPLYWWAFGGVRRSGVYTFGQTYYNFSEKILQNSLWKLYVPIFISSSKQSPVGCDNHSNWLIFYYLTRPGLKECPRT